MLDAIHPNVLALCSAALIAFARVSQCYAISRMKMHTANLAMGCVTAAIGWFFCWLEGADGRMPWQGVFWFMAMGFFGSFAGRYINFIAIRWTGLARAAVMSQTVLVWASMLAVFILGERMTIPKALGIAGVMCGASMLVYDPKGDVRRRVPLRYYLIPVASAAMYAFAHLVGKFAFEWISSAPSGWRSPTRPRWRSCWECCPSRGKERLQAGRGTEKGFSSFFWAPCFKDAPFSSSGLR